MHGQLGIIPHPVKSVVAGRNVVPGRSKVIQSAPTISTLVDCNCDTPALCHGRQVRQGDLELTPACASGDVEVVIGRTQALEHLGAVVSLRFVRLAGIHTEFLGKVLPTRLHNGLLLHGAMLESQGRT